MKTIQDINDSSILVIHGKELKAILTNFQEGITRKIEHLGNPARWVKSREAEQVLGVSKSTLRRLVEDGKLTPSREQRDLTFCLADLIAYKRKNQGND